MKYSYSEIRKLCLKPDEAKKQFYTRYVTHTISTWLIWLCQDLKVGPNLITFISLLFAFLAVPFFVAMTPVSVIIGALLLEIYYVLDAVDGEWARFKNMKSMTGSFFDYSVNYMFQPPLLFGIGWGVFSQTGEMHFIVLGALAAFASLWVLMIWNIRASILLHHLTLNPAKTVKLEAEGPETGQQNSSLAKSAFSWMHKVLVFPWMMYAINLTAVACFVNAQLGNNTFSADPFYSLFLYYYGIAGPAIAIAITARWIINKKIDRAV